MRPLDGLPAVVRTDPAPGFKALTDDQQLKHQSITIDLRHAKNQNKNPVAKRGVQELENELPPLGPVSLLTLGLANLNVRIHSHGPSLIDVDTVGSILQPSNTAAWRKHHRSAEQTAYRQPHPWATPTARRQRPPSWGAAQLIKSLSVI